MKDLIYKAVKPYEEDINDLVEKSGEGSRGGKVIGHTSTGKAIYDSASHADHSHFNSQDHHDAAAIHRKYYSSKKLKDHAPLSRKDKEGHDSEANAHFKAGGGDAKGQGGDGSLETYNKIARGHAHAAKHLSSKHNVKVSQNE